MLGLVSCAAFGAGLAVSGVGAVQEVNALAGAAVLNAPPGPSALYAWKKWTLSNMSLTTCVIPLPSWHEDALACAGAAGFADALVAPATPTPAIRAAVAAIAETRLDLGRRIPRGHAGLTTVTCSSEN